MIYLSTTVMGLEDIASKEIKKFGGEIKKAERGKVLFVGDEDLIYKLNYVSKGVFRITLLLGMGRIENLNDIREIIKNSDFCIKRTFAVRSKRKGKHEFTSMDINAVVGEEILKKCPEAKVNLDDPDVTFLTWLEDEDFFFTMDTTGESLHRRGYRVYQHPAPINPVLASLMLRFAGWSGERLVDPFCGSGTILIEAYHNYNGIPNKWRDFSFKKLPIYDEERWKEIKHSVDREMKNKKLNLIGVERFEKHVRGCIKNLEHSAVKANCILGDAEKLHEYVRGTEHIITNPPFGLRIGSKKKIFRLYENFARELEEHFSGAILTLIIPYKKFEVYFDVLEKREIMYGDLHTKIYRFKI
ncbi:putative N6-adenine-specific DNA methylase [Aciduliprofundum sp. MAR08-339]|uniref:tRNA (guanine(6)-N2)-methyltransferase n=1 Tax=Aciduliprofundum sp. (strain MAR08-339) TaxID=673860 RepID=UPI0002A491AC|nr:putative N6-adenine-specific DNA methylase [Aciduliprofundum sp. MAR08-339]